MNTNIIETAGTVAVGSSAVLGHIVITIQSYMLQPRNISTGCFEEYQKATTAAMM